MLDHNNKCIFVHIPKTAGQSIEQVFLNMPFNTVRSLLLYKTDIPVRGPQILSHLTAHQYLQNSFIPRAYFNHYFKFSFVRNPWGRLVSWYFFKRPKVPFRAWIKNLPKSGGQERLQYDYLHKGGKLLVDFIGRFENLQEDFNYVCDKIGIPPQQLPHRNKTKHKHYTEYYDDEARAIVAELYAKDIEYFGYEFGG
jgi:hypothetical protein